MGSFLLFLLLIAAVIALIAFAAAYGKNMST
jgi:hypothetical protein